MTVLTISTRPVPLEQPLRLPARARDHGRHPTAPRDVDRDADRPDSVFGTGDEMNVTVRMVIPLRREFGRMLDVSHFMHDDVYARGMIDLAKSSSDARLRGYATFLNSHSGLVPAEPPAGKLSSSGEICSCGQAAGGSIRSRRLRRGEAAQRKSGAGPARPDRTGTLPAARGGRYRG